MSQHPAPNVPITPPGVHATDPASVPDLTTEGRAHLDLVGWDDNDRLVVRERALWVECACPCGVDESITDALPAWADSLAALMVWATNNLPALLAEIDALHNDLAAKRSDFDAACARLGELEDQAASHIAANRDLSRERTVLRGKVAELQGVISRSDDRAGKLAEIRALATRWATQPNDYDEDTETQIDDGRTVLAILDRTETGGN